MKKRPPEFENHERWLVSYADMLTLLFAVFVTLYALNSGERVTNVNDMAGSLQESFSTPLEDIPLDRRDRPDDLGLGVYDEVKGNTLDQAEMREQMDRLPATIEISEDLQRLKKLIRERLYGPNAVPEVKGDEGTSRIIDIFPSQKGFKLNLVAKYFFPAAGYALSPEGKKYVDQVVDILKEQNKPVVIEGHTDAIAPSGQLDNWQLSTLRATEVLKYLIIEHNFPRQMISAAGYADTRPIAHNGTEAGRSMNRRIEIHVENQAG